MSKAYELFMPAVFDVSARDGSVSKNSCTVPAIYRSFRGLRASLCAAVSATALPSRPDDQGRDRAPGTGGRGRTRAARCPAAGRRRREASSTRSSAAGSGRLGESGELRGERGEAVLLHLDGELEAPRLVAAGVGKREEVDADALRTAGAAAAQALSRVGGTLVWLLDESLPVPLPEQAAALVEGTILGAYSPGRWKSKQDAKAPERIVIGHEDDPELQAAVERAAILAERANRARDLSNMPPNELTPHTLGREGEGARRRARASDLRGARRRASSTSSAWARSPPSAAAAATSRA